MQLRFFHESWKHNFYKIFQKQFLLHSKIFVAKFTNNASLEYWLIVYSWLTIFVFSILPNGTNIHLEFEICPKEIMLHPEKMISYFKMIYCESRLPNVGRANFNSLKEEKKMKAKQPEKQSPKQSISHLERKSIVACQVARC